jgi:hypothetical protein
MAVARPAAPPPTTATSQELIRRKVYAALGALVVSSSGTNIAASLRGTDEIAPHALHRTVRVVVSSALPITWVR